jgi:outer membrane protein
MHNRSLFLPLWLLLCPLAMRAQEIVTQLPDAPQVQAQAQRPTPALNSATTNSPSPLPPDSTGEMLTRQQAEQLALKNNPRISVATLLALAQKQVVRETRSALLPTLNGNVSGVDAVEASRISAGSLEASRLLNHVGAGVDLNQLITDFGRTRNLVASSSYEAKASAQQSEATREDIVLAADIAFYNALEAQATLQVAKSTVKARQAVGDQVNALTASKLKSTLDQSFAQVNLSQAKLLDLDSQNQFDAAMANLNEVLGTVNNQQFQLVDDPSPPLPVAPSADAVIALALQQRPDLLALKLTYFSPDWYGAAGVNIGIPIFEGFKFHAQAAEADLRAKASDEQSRVLINRIVRDVRTAWLRANTAQQKMSVTAELLQEANTALDLADTRYRLGLSSIVELSQAQLQQTQAQIAEANARFDYEADLAALRFQSGSQP